MIKFCVIAMICIICAIGMAGCGICRKESEKSSRSEKAVAGLTEKESSKNTGKEVDNAEKAVEAFGSWERGSISLRLPEGWSYELEQDDDAEIGEWEFGMRFYPDQAKNGSIFVGCNNFFGVCGTGLEESDTEVNGMPARMGVYDNQTYWTFLVLTDGKGEDDLYNDHYVILYEPGNDAEDWWADHGETVENILDTLVIE